MRVEKISIKDQFNKSKGLPMFEIEVTDLRSNETDFIVFDLKAFKHYFKVTHQPMTEEQENSSKTASFTMEIDEALTLDEHLNELYQKCCDEITDSDYYTLND